MTSPWSSEDNRPCEDAHQIEQNSGMTDATCTAWCDEDSSCNAVTMYYHAGNLCRKFTQCGTQYDESQTKTFTPASERRGRKLLAKSKAGAGSDNTPCIACPSGEFSYRDDNGFQTCGSTCPAGEQPTNGACVACEDSPPNIYSDPNSASCVLSCPAGYGVDTSTNECVQCGQNSLPAYVDRAATPSICVSNCPTGRGPDGNNDCMLCGGNTPYTETDGNGINQCVATCTAGSAPDINGACTACGSTTPYADMISAMACVAACPAGHAPDGNNDCAQCTGGQPYADLAQSPPAGVGTCPAGFAPQDGGNLPAGGNCVRCAGGTPYADHAAHRCVSECPTGQTPGAAGGDANDCEDCPSNTFADHINHVCVDPSNGDKCPAGYAPDANKDDCVNCGHASGVTDKPFADMANEACVSVCPDGQAPNADGDCKPCGGQKPYSRSDTHTCDDTCPAGHGPDTWGGTNACKPCNSVNSGNSPFADHFIAGQNACVDQCHVSAQTKASKYDANMDCVACPSSSPYADGANNQCLAICPTNQGPDTDNVCQDCGGGTPYWKAQPDSCVDDCGVGQAPDGNGVCQACNGGTPYADHVNQACVATCPSGYIQNDENDCEQCNQYIDYIGEQCVQWCPRGPAPAGGTGIHLTQIGNAYVGANGECVECNDASAPFADYAAGQCVAQCPGGTFANYIWACRPCGTSTSKAYSDQTFNRCVDVCPSGQIPDDSGNCADCTGGTPYADHVAGSCVANCPAGSEVDDVTGKDCKTRPPNFTPSQQEANRLERVKRLERYEQLKHRKFKLYELEEE